MARGENEILRFVRESLARQIPRADVERKLGEAGWRKEQIRKALASFAEVEFAIPVPRPTPYLSARDAFLYLLLFTTLYISAYHLSILVFQFIDMAFPDRALRGYAYWYPQRVRWSVSSLIVAFPVFLFVSHRIQQVFRADPERRASPVRKWLTYVALLIAASILIGDLITLIYNVLGGELTVRFVLKALTAGAIAGAIFAYYLADLPKESEQ